MAADTKSATDSLEGINDSVGPHYLPKYSTLSKTVLDRGKNKFASCFIDGIKMFHTNGSEKVEVCATCYRSYHKKAAPHKMALEVDNKRQLVVEAKCECKAGLEGHCSHIIGLLKTLQYFKLQNMTHIPDRLSCISMPQTWGVAAPRGTKIDPVPINHLMLSRPLDNRKKRPITCQLDTSRKVPEVTQDQVKKLKSLDGTPLTYLLTPDAPTMATPLGDVQIGSALSYQTRNLKRQTVPGVQQRCGDMCVTKTSPVDLPQEFDCLRNICQCPNPDKLEEKTREQTSSDDWVEARKQRLTASNFHRVLIRKANVSEKFLDSIFSPTPFSTQATDYGTRHENSAKSKYLEVFPDRNLHKCGIVVNSQFPFLGASPDGKLCDNGKTGIIEVKCPFAHRNATILEACQLPGFCLEETDGNVVQLKKSHAYYSQVQGQLLVTGCDFCDFIVYTQRDIHVQRITPDIPFMTAMLRTLSVFYKEHATRYFAKK